MISCIMPTRGRRAFMEQAVKLFLAQDYPNKELVTLEDGNEVNWDVMAGTNYHHLGGSHHSIGYKRNFAYLGRIARGEIICQWDDDDWFSPQRLSLQVEPILRGEADVTALRMVHMLHASTGVLWECSEDVHRALFSHNVRAGTLMYRASYWRDGLRYEDSSHGEDVAFLRGLLAKGARLQPVVAPGAYVCIRHGSNVTAEIDGLDLPGWQQIPMEQVLPEDDRAFYKGLALQNASA
ncbi:MAG TPA: glycosyltransferase family 2 protein [Ktedonobacteraceae bacterium]|nr:glycosyltransferase family 2 protein [Ktedonobacteraceae bacterium]